jgi:hypothetical protein
MASFNGRRDTFESRDLPGFGNIQRGDIGDVR